MATARVAARASMPVRHVAARSTRRRPDTPRRQNADRQVATAGSHTSALPATRRATRHRRQRMHADVRERSRKRMTAPRAVAWQCQTNTPPRPSFHESCACTRTRARCTPTSRAQRGHMLHVPRRERLESSRVWPTTRPRELEIDGPKPRENDPPKATPGLGGALIECSAKRHAARALQVRVRLAMIVRPSLASGRPSRGLRAAAAQGLRLGRRKDHAGHP